MDRTAICGKGCRLTKSPAASRLMGIHKAVDKCDA